MYNFYYLVNRGINVKCQPYAIGVYYFFFYLGFALPEFSLCVLFPSDFLFACHSVSYIHARPTSQHIHTIETSLPTSLMESSIVRVQNRGRTHIQTHALSLYVYIFISLCVRVCVCVCWCMLFLLWLR